MSFFDQQVDAMSIYIFQLPDRKLEIRAESDRYPEQVLKEWVEENHPTATDIYGEYILKEASYCGEVYESLNPQSVCLSPWAVKTMKSMDPEVLAFAKEHGITVRTMEQYEYACHIFDKVYDAGEV